MASDAKQLQDLSPGLIKARPHWRKYFGDGYNNTFVPLQVYKWGLETFAEALKKIPKNKKAKVLDGGCGTGVYWGWLYNKFSFKSLCAFDYMPEAIIEARKAGESLRLLGVECDIFEHNLVNPWPVADSSIDLGVFNLSDCYLPPGGWLWTIHEKRRVLRPGAYQYTAYIAKEFSFKEHAGPEYFRQYESPEQTAIFMQGARPHLIQIGMLLESGELCAPPEKEIVPAYEEAGFEVISAVQYYPHMWGIFTRKPR